MSEQPGFVITISCEDFFKDARQNLALFFHETRMKTVGDLKQRLKCLVRQDFYVLWKPHDEENYYYLLEDEKLHFVQPKDKFRLCKIKENVGYEVEKVDIEKKAHLEEYGLNKQEDSHDETIGVKKSSIDDTVEDILMEYEDVVDQGIKKKRKRTRKHKSKKQKVEENGDCENALVKVEREPVEEPRIGVKYYSELGLGEMRNGHIRFETTNKSTDQVDSEQVKGIDNDDLNNIVKTEETPKKERRKSKKSKCNTSYQTCEQVTEPVNGCGGDSPSTPAYVEPSSISSFNTSKSNMVTSTAINSPSSSTLKARRRFEPQQSLAGFISQLSKSLKKSPVCENLLDRTCDTSVNNNISFENTKDLTLKQVDQISTDSTVPINNIPRRDMPSSVDDLNNTCAQPSEISYKDRKLVRKNRIKLGEVNGDQYAVLENLSQWKHSNLPDMPLVFERNVTDRRKSDKKQDVDGQVSTLDKTAQHVDVAKQEDSGCPRFSDVEQMLNEIVMMSDEELATFPVLTEPQEDDVICFKVLKMDASYNPSLSNHICGKINSVCKLSSQLSLEILLGVEELKPPTGKFSLNSEEEEENIEPATTEHSINWNELYDTRLLMQRKRSSVS